MKRRYLLHHLLEHSAQRVPDAEALRGGDSSVSYGQLEQRSNRIARALAAEGVGAGDRVGLHLKKTPEAIVALFAILKAGACAVPVGPGTPPARFRDIVDQCAMRCVIGDDDALGRLGAEVFDAASLECALVTGGAGEALEGLDIRRVGLAEAEVVHSDEPPAVPVVDRDLAYVLFTSGSTGRPKGVMLSHQAVLTFVTWASEEFAIRGEDRLSNHAPLNFDLSTFDIYAAMGAGASVTLVPENLAMFPTRLAELIERSAITVWYSVPSVLTLLVTRGQLDQRDLSALRLVLFAGEVFPPKYLRRLMLAHPRATYVNLYGPTETNVCTFHEVRRPPEADGPPIPIGRACSNTRTVVLDAHGSPVGEPGGEGLLYVGGSCLMDGYYGRPEETAGVFVTNPLTEGREERLYCTGDLVVIGEGGEYHFLGRRDHMVKVGGFRIELGEIESALYAHEGVRDVAAVALPDELLGNRVGAVVVRADPALDEQQLKRHCGALLPKYMVPHEIRFADGLPRTATDKVDRPRLLAEAFGAGRPAG